MESFNNYLSGQASEGVEPTVRNALTDTPDNYIKRDR